MATAPTSNFTGCVARTGAAAPVEDDVVVVVVVVCNFSMPDVMATVSRLADTSEIRVLMTVDPVLVWSRVV